MGEEYTTVDPSLLVAQTSWVKSLANHLVRDPDGAEDVAQETLLAALSSPPQDAADAKRLRAWLGRVAFNLAHLSRRRNGRRRAREERAARSEREPSTAQSYVDGSIDELVVKAVHGLEEPYRTTVELRYFEGLSTTEVADRTSTTNSAVRKRLWRARGKLRRELDTKHNGERHAWFRALAPLAGIPIEDLATGAGASGFGWKAAAAVPLLVFGAWSARELLTDARSAAPTDTGVGTNLASVAEVPRVRSAVEFDSVSLVDRKPTPDSEAPSEPRVRNERVEVGPAVEPDIAEQAAVQGYVVDLWGNPLGGAALVAEGAPAKVLGRTGADGSFHLTDLALPLGLRVLTPGFTTLHGPRVEPGEESFEHWLVVAPSVSLAGVVVDEFGQELSDAVVEVAYDSTAFVELPVLVDVSDSTPPKARTDEGGAFRLAEVPSGAGISLRIDHPAFELAWVPVPESTHLGLEIELQRRRELETLAGVVVDEEQRAVSGAVVAMGSSSAVTDETGSFELQVVADSGASLRAKMDGYLPTSMVTDLAHSQRQRLRMVMRAADQVVLGQVVDEEGQPLAGWLVFATPPVPEETTFGSGDETEAGEVPSPVLTDESGGFRIDGLGKQEYALVGLDPETLCLTQPCEAQGGAGGVRLEARTREVAEVLPGRVLARDGSPLAHALVRAELSISTDSGTFRATSQSTRTDRQGRFELARVAGRHVRIRIDHPGSESVIAAPVLRPGRPAEFVIDLLQPVRFAGNVDSVVVLDASGQPLSMRGCSTRSSRASLVRGRSAVMGVGSQACTVVWYDDGVEVGRQPVVIHARSVEALGLPLDIQR